MRPLTFALATLLTAFGFSKANALCIYKGDFDVKTTIRQEFRDSRWVVRAKVLKAQDHYSKEDAPYTTYQIAVDRAYKGSPPKHLVFFTMRDSGGFYLDNDTSHDIGGKYLLFLNPNIRDKGDPAAIVGTVSVNYSCGQSKTWREVRRSEILELEGLSKR